MEQWERPGPITQSPVVPVTTGGAAQADTPKFPETRQLSTTPASAPSAAEPERVETDVVPVGTADTTEGQGETAADSDDEMEDGYTEGPATPPEQSSGAALESTNKGDKHSGAPGTNLDTAAVENDATAASKSSSAAREGGPEATDAEMTKAGAIAFKRARETPDRTGNVDTSAINEPPTKTATGRRPTFKPRPNLSPDRRGTQTSAPP
ncbi:hypothetical protein MRX96_017892 [Rhipicephalus microplus]